MVKEASEQEEKDLDGQLISALRNYGPAVRGWIRWEATEFVYGPELLTLCKMGGQHMDGIHFRNCVFRGMPLGSNSAKNPLHFFASLLEFAESGHAIGRMVPCIRFEFAEAKPLPRLLVLLPKREERPFRKNGHPPLPPSKLFVWDGTRGHFVCTRVFTNRIQDNIKHKLVMTCTQERVSFNTFSLTKCGFLPTVKRAIGGLRSLGFRSRPSKSVAQISSTTMTAEQGQQTVEMEEEDEENGDEEMALMYEYEEEAEQQPIAINTNTVETEEERRRQLAPCSPGQCDPHNRYTCGVHQRYTYKYDQQSPGQNK